MSFGERSCIHRGNCFMPDESHSFYSCNVDCPEYVWDRKTKPDSEPEINKSLPDKHWDKLKCMEIRREVESCEYKAKCPKCGKSNAIDCGRLILSSGYDSPIEYDCDFGWEELGIDPPDCDICPLLLCKECRDVIVAKYWYRQNLWKELLI